MTKPVQLTMMMANIGAMKAQMTPNSEDSQHLSAMEWRGDTRNAKL